MTCLLLYCCSIASRLESGQHGTTAAAAMPPINGQSSSVLCGQRALVRACTLGSSPSHCLCRWKQQWITHQKCNWEAFLQYYSLHLELDSYCSDLKWPRKGISNKPQYMYCVQMFMFFSCAYLIELCLHLLCVLRLKSDLPCLVLCACRIVTRQRETWHTLSVYWAMSWSSFRWEFAANFSSSSSLHGMST